MSRYTNDKKTTQVILFALMGLILVSYVAAAIQTSYAQEVVKTLRIKVVLDKNVITRGDTQTIRMAVVDANTGQPVSGAVARATVKYADGVTVRQFATTTDAFGHASISWQIENDATPGTFTASFTISAAAYVEEVFDNSFSVVINSINGNHNNNHHRHHHN